MSREYRAGNDSDPARVRDVIHGLKVMARLGDRARRALAAYEAGEEFPEPFPWASSSHKGYPCLDDLIVHSSGGLYERTPVRREDHPGWGRFSLELGALEKRGAKKGAKIDQFPVHVVGDSLHVDTHDDVGRTSVVKVRTKVGTVRLKSGGLSMHLSYRVSGNHVVQLRRDPSRSGAAEAFAESAADALVWGWSPYEDGLVPAAALETRRLLPEWLLEDVVPGWITRIFDWSKDVRTITEVMDT